MQARRQDLAVGGPKTRRGGHILKYCIRRMQQPGDQTWNGGSGTTGPPAGDGPA